MRRGIRPSWRHRRFEPESTTGRPKAADFLRLAYSDADGHKKGIIRLDDATDVRPSTATSGRTHGLDGRTDDWEMEVVTPERTWRLRLGI